LFAAVAQPGTAQDWKNGQQVILFPQGYPGSKETSESPGRGAHTRKNQDL